MKINKLLIVCLAVAMSVPGFAQENAGTVLSQIEKNNTALQALRKRTEADQYGYKAERALDATEVGFDYLWSSPADVGTRKDISVTQSIDVAALAGARGKLADSRTELSDIQYNIERQKILLEAKQLYIRIVYCNAVNAELSSRIARSEQIEAAYRDMQARGETDMIEVNKAHLAYLSQKNALSRNMVERESLLSELQGLNGGEPVEVNASVISTDEVLPADFGAWYAEASQQIPELAYMKKNVDVNAAEARTAKMANYPSLTAGYMAELVKGSNFRGLTLGLSIPIWSVRSKVRQANASCEAAKLEERDAETRTYNSFKALYDRAKGLQEISAELSSSLAVSTEAMALTEHKLKAGDISLIDNIMELSLYYSLADEVLATSCDYALALAELYAWNL
ncbi:outer membrane efflux protein [Bacteroides sp. CAG:709]|nr:outer membrane efflux protein [Bacteroides sp. CAG:709]